MSDDRMSGLTLEVDVTATDLRDMDDDYDAHGYKEDKEDKNTPDSPTVKIPFVERSVPDSPTLRMERGALIAVEGLDRAGKSTQCSLLLKKLNAEGVPTVYQKFPDRTTPIGLMINSYLRNAENLDDRAIHLLFSANRWELCEKIKSQIAFGTTVILDRYIYSGIVFSAAKQRRGGQNLSLDWCRQPDKGLPRPDIVIFLSISQEEAAKRSGYGQERYEKKEIQAKVRDLFDDLRKDARSEGDWWVVNAGQKVNFVTEDVREGARMGMRRAAMMDLRSFE